MTNDSKDFRPLTFVESIVVVILFNNLFSINILFNFLKKNLFYNIKHGRRINATRSLWCSRYLPYW